MLLFLIPNIYLHGILARILGHCFAGFLVPNEAPGRSSSLKETEGDEAIQRIIALKSLFGRKTSPCKLSCKAFSDKPLNTVKNKD